MSVSNPSKKVGEQTWTSWIGPTRCWSAVPERMMELHPIQLSSRKLRCSQFSVMIFAEVECCVSTHFENEHNENITKQHTHIFFKCADVSSVIKRVMNRLLHPATLTFCTSCVSFPKYVYIIFIYLFTYIILYITNIISYMPITLIFQILCNL